MKNSKAPRQRRGEIVYIIKEFNGCAGMVDRLRLGRRGVSHISSSLIVHIIYVV